MRYAGTPLFTETLQESVVLNAVEGLAEVEEDASPNKTFTFGCVHLREDSQNLVRGGPLCPEATLGVGDLGMVSKTAVDDLLN